MIIQAKDKEEWKMGKIIPRRFAKEMRRKLTFLYWLHEFTHALACKLLKIRYEIFYDEGKPCAVIVDSKDIFVSVFPIILIMPFYVWDLKGTLIEELKGTRIG